jgi:RND family efflux transporter MFP subunit
VEVAIPEVLIARIKVGSPVTVTFDAIPEKQFPAEVTEVGISSTGFATTFPVTVRLEQRDREIRPGMAAEVAFRFASDSEERFFMVPPQSVGEDRQGRFVFVVEPAEAGFGIVRRRDVETGELTSEGLEVMSGITDGERLVTAGISKIEDGLKVKLAASN